MLNSFRSIHRSLSLSLSLQISLFFSHAPWLARIFLLLLSGSQVSFTITGGGGQGSLFETLTILSSQSGRVSFHFNPIKGTGDLYPLWNKQIKDPTLETHICCCCCTHRGRTKIENVCHIHGSSMKKKQKQRFTGLWLPWLFPFFFLSFSPIRMTNFRKKMIKIEREKKMEQIEVFDRLMAVKKSDREKM